MASVLYYSALRGAGSAAPAAAAAKPQAAKPVKVVDPTKNSSNSSSAKKRQEKKPAVEKKESAAASSSSSTGGKVTFSVKKNEDFHEWYEQIIRFAEIMDKRFPVKGMPVFRPYGFFIHNKIMSIIGEEWEKQGIEQALFPLLIPQHFLSLEGEHVEGFKAEVYWVTEGGDTKFSEKRALRPTSETAIYYMFAQWIQSFRDLPLKVHQTCNVFRYETQQTRPLIRAREIHWNEAHTAHANREDALENLEKAWRSYLYLINDCCCFFGLRLRRPEWDKFPGAEHTDVMDTVMPCGKVLQTVGAHYLGQKFSKAFDIKFLDKDNKTDLAHLTCYGISTRLLAALLSLHGDDNGLVLPPILARYQVVIVPILGKQNNEILARARDVKELLETAGIRVFLDDASDTPGEKYFRWEMKGVPIRIEIGTRDLGNNQVTVVPRDTRVKQSLSNVDLIPGVRHQLEALTTRLQANARSYHESQVKNCSNAEEIAAAVTKGGFARFPYYSMDTDGKDGDAKVHEICGGEIRGSRPDEGVPPAGTLCALTGRPATAYAYAARSY